MTPFSFATAARIMFGRGTAAQASGEILRYGKSVLVVHGANADRAKWLVQALEANGQIVSALPCGTEPTLAMLESGLAVARASGVDVVVALGGGAVIDLGKAIAALAPGTGTPLDHLEVVGRGLPLAAPPLPFIVLPTTSGTGAEVTKNAVIGIPDHARKVSLRDDRMLARLAIVDPALTDGCPRGVTLASGLDALTQVIEPYLSSRATPITDALCVSVISRAVPALQTLMAQDDPAARDTMAYVSLMGGMALANAGLGAVHGFAGVIGGTTGAAHGAICGALLPHVLAALKAQAGRGSVLEQRLGQVENWIAPAFGAAPQAAFAALAAWSREQGLPGLRMLGVTDRSLADVAAQSAAASSMKASAIAFSTGQLIDILQAAMD